MAESGAEDWARALKGPWLIARARARATLEGLLRSAADKISAGAEPDETLTPARLGLTRDEISAILFDAGPSSSFRLQYPAVVEMLRTRPTAPPLAPPASPVPPGPPRKPRIGPRMRQIQTYASCFPGESVTSVLLGCGIPTHRSSYRAAIYRAEDAGLIVIERVRCNLYRVFATERDKKIFYLRRELLAPGTPADRVAALRADIDALRAEQAQTWLDPAPGTTVPARRAAR